MRRIRIDYVFKVGGEIRHSHLDADDLFNDGAEWLSKIRVDCEYVATRLSTGLKDHDDTEIFEGDILKMPYLNCHCEVRFNCGKWVYQSKKGEFYGTAWDLYPHVIDAGEAKISGKIVGNVYENPELLEVANA